MNSGRFLEELQEELTAVFEHLHTHAEVSWQEHQTTAFLAQQLIRMGIRVQTFEDVTGVIGEWGPVGGPVVALRSDIDALWQEVDGVWQANHSCGHDGHMTMVLGAVKLLRQLMPEPSVRIRVLFQPAEEKGDGARRFVECGAVEDVVYLFGVHVRPIQELAIGKMSAAIYNGASTEVEGRIQGCAAHGARPHLGVNPIEVAFGIMQAVQSIHLDPMVPYTAKMTRLIAGGDSTNIIPDTASFSFDLRAQTNAVMNLLVQQVEERIQAVARMYHAEVQLKRSGETVAAQVSQEARDLLAAAIADVLGPDALSGDIVTPGAEDFHYYTVLSPNLKATMLGLGCGVSPGLHHPNMTFDRSRLFDGTRILAEAVMKACEYIAK